MHFLSKFSTNPHMDYYLAFERNSLLPTKVQIGRFDLLADKPVEQLPNIPFEILQEDPSLPVFPKYGFTELVAFANAAYTTDVKTWHSITSFRGAAMAYAKLQATVTASSTKVELIAAVYTAKAVKHLYSVLSDFNLLLTKPSIIYEYNKATINMINKSKPTAWSQHIDVQHFAIQEWQDWGEIKKKHIPRIINPVDDETKALCWVLHSWHSWHAMGHYGPWFGEKISSTSHCTPTRLESIYGLDPGRMLLYITQSFHNKPKHIQQYDDVLLTEFSMYHLYCTYYPCTKIPLMYEQTIMIKVFSCFSLSCHSWFPLHNFLQLTNA